MTKSITELPLKLYSIHDTLNRLETIRLLHNLNDHQHANLLAKQTVSFLDQELSYIASLSPQLQHASLRDIQLGMYILNGLDELTAKDIEPEFNRKIRIKYKELEDVFSRSLGWLLGSLPILQRKCITIVIQIINWYLCVSEFLIQKIMEQIFDRIYIDANICNGKPIIRGKRIAVQTIMEFLSAGESFKEILKQYPSLEAADITACMRYATELMNHSFIIKQAVA